ncbi:hypothetical protein cypCar_00036819 [Cyprinus carpio]|nr:hypothetical protein cypCar_00036819 [Cyprinus carpio]
MLRKSEHSQAYRTRDKRGVFGVEEITMSVTEEDFVTLHTGVKTNHQDRIRWYYNDIRIAQITGNLIKTCKDVQCDEIFRDRLELDNQTGSLSITSIMTADAGHYKLKILGNPSSEKIFNVTVHGEAFNKYLKANHICLNHNFNVFIVNMSDAIECSSLLSHLVKKKDA